MNVYQAKDSFDFFWVFVPRYDSWRLGRTLGSTRAVGLFQDGAWVILTDFNDGWEAIGVEMPKHPRSVTEPKP